MQSKVLRKLKNHIGQRMRYRPPAALARNFVAVDARGQEALIESLKRHYFTRRIWQDATLGAEAWLATSDGQRDLEMHLWSRTDLFRRTVVPWLDRARPLAGATVLEIGCGTGASTVALAEQGARVTGVDIDEPSLRVAQDRAHIYRQAIRFCRANATEVHQLLAGQKFDLVIFLASLEHMLYGERIAAIRSTWDMLESGGLWCMADTPNRLWRFDGHTSDLPFYHWLPDDLAFAYSRYSGRQQFARSYTEESPQAMESFLRHGRGVSYHEFELALGQVETLDVVSSLPIFLRRQSLFGLRELRWRLSSDYRFQASLAAMRPKIHRGFYEPSLELIVRKHEALT